MTWHERRYRKAPSDVAFCQITLVLVTLVVVRGFTDLDGSFKGSMTWHWPLCGHASKEGGQVLCHQRWRPHGVEQVRLGCSVRLTLKRWRYHRQQFSHTIRLHQKLGILQRIRKTTSLQTTLNRHIISTRHSMLSALYAITCPSVRLSHGCGPIIQKWLKLGLWNFLHTVAPSR